MKNLCVIPAKLLSKRLPMKNIKVLFGKPVIYYSIKTALKSKLFSKVFVSTDSHKIAKLSKKYGADTSFLRPKSLTKINTPIVDVVKYAIKKFEKKEIFFDYVCCLFPVAPLISTNLLRTSFKKTLKSKAKFVFPVINNEESSNQHYFHINEKSLIYKIFKTKPKKSQKKIYSDAGQFYWGSSNNWVEKNSKIIKKKTSEVMIINKNSGIDVNFKSDWIIIKKLFKKKYDNKM